MNEGEVYFALFADEFDPDEVTAIYRNQTNCDLPQREAPTEVHFLEAFRRKGQR